METQNEKTRSLLFVYNAESGLFNLLSDIAKKSFQGHGVCTLCDLTHDPLTVKKEWRKFVESLPIKTEFDYKNTFLEKYPKMSDTQFPAIFMKEEMKEEIKRNAQLREILSAERINATKDLKELQKLILSALDS